MRHGKLYLISIDWFITTKTYVPMRCLSRAIVLNQGLWFAKTWSQMWSISGLLLGHLRRASTPQENETRLPQHPTNDKSPCEMAWCHQTTYHYLGQCWRSSASPYGVWPYGLQWVNATWRGLGAYEDTGILKYCSLFCCSKMLPCISYFTNKLKKGLNAQFYKFHKFHDIFHKQTQTNMASLLIRNCINVYLSS